MKLERGRRTSNCLGQSLWSYSGVTKCLPAYYRRFRMSILDYYSRFRISTRLLLSLRSSNRGCQMCISLRRSLRSLNGGCQMCISLRQSLRSSNGDCQMCTSLRQSLRSSNRDYPSIVSAAFERELAFDSLCRV